MFVKKCFINSIFLFYFQVIELKQLVEELCDRDGKKHPVSFVSTMSDASRSESSPDAQRQSKDLLVNENKIAALTWMPSEYKSQ